MCNHMPYILSPRDTEKIKFLAATGSKVLRQLRLPFNRAYLNEKLVLAYHSVFDAGPAQGTDAADGADRDDAANLSIVLLNALASYHIKSNVVENGERQEGAVLVILTPKENTGYRELIGLYDSMEIKNAIVEHYILLERSPLSGEPGYQKLFWEKQLQLLLGAVSIAMLATLVAMAIWNGIQYAGTLSWIFPLVIVAAGLYIGYDLFQLERNNVRNDYLTKKLCVNDQKGLSCQQVLKSKAAKIAGVLSMTDIGIVYFSSIFFFLIYNLISHAYAANLGVFLLASIIPLPYVGFSIYYQLRVIKKVCILCMITQALLVLQFLFFIPARANNISLAAIISLLLITLLTTLLYFFYSRSNKQKTELKRLQTESYMQKNDEEFFNLMLHREPRYAEPDLDGMIRLGNPDAGVKITAFLSLSCTPCSNMLNVLARMADWFTDQISVSILLMPDEPSKELLQAIYYHTLKEDHAKALEILIGSYANNNQPPEGFINDKRAACKNTLYKHGRWLQHHYVPHTPAVLYKGHSLPPAWHDEALVRNIIARELEKITVAS